MSLRALDIAALIFWFLNLAATSISYLNSKQVKISGSIVNKATQNDKLKVFTS